MTEPTRDALLVDGVGGEMKLNHFNLVMKVLHIQIDSIELSKRKQISFRKKSFVKQQSIDILI